MQDSLEPKNSDQTQYASQADHAVAEGGAYEVIRHRLLTQGKQLNEGISKINEERIAEFGNTEMSILGRFRVRTENNCWSRDIVRVGPWFLFGYNVFMGLKKETAIEDVFSLYEMMDSSDDIEFKEVSSSGTFLSAPEFVKDFKELYSYFSESKLIQMVVKDSRLYAIFQIGQQLTDVRVFRWQISTNQDEVQYIDNRGEGDITLPEPYDFQWIKTNRDQAVYGKHPHINIIDTVFVETVGGDLTIKVENNTQDGLGIYRENVEDKTQSLDDAEIYYAEVGHLILLKVLPYREDQWRFLVFNKISKTVSKIDEIGQACLQLPEDHGIIFPGGVYLQDGDQKTFPDDMTGMRFQRSIQSPNGEDVLYVFYEPEEGKVALYTYNLVNKTIQKPIFGHGYGVLDDGRMVIFYSEAEEATRVHPMQIWGTPFYSDEYSSHQTPSNTFYGKIGNAELVRGISDLYSISKTITVETVSSEHYEQLVAQTKRVMDAFHWIDKDEMQDIRKTLLEIIDTSELVLDEYEKVLSIQAKSKEVMIEAENKQTELLSSLREESWKDVSQFVDGLNSSRLQRGHLISIKDHRYIDLTRVNELEEQLVQRQESLSVATSEFLSRDDALSTYQAKLDEMNAAVEAAETRSLLNAPLEAFDKMAEDLDIISELVSSLKVEDATVKTRIVDSMSEVYAKLNQSKAKANNKYKTLGADEALLQFGAQFKLFTQSISHALAMSTTPALCDEHLSRLLFQLEEIEGQFSEYDDFLNDIISKREEVYESFESHKQTLLDARQKKAQNIQDAASRILQSIQRRAGKMDDVDHLNSFFASDPLILKVKTLIDQLRDLDDAVRADDIEAKLKSVQDQSVRGLKDKAEIFEEGGSVIKLGPRHRFSVNQQNLDLTLLTRDGDMNIHLSGTDYFEPIDDDSLILLKDYWDVHVESESSQIYRAEFLAGLVIDLAKDNSLSVNYDELVLVSTDKNKLLSIVREVSGPRFKEGYEKGIHDEDAVKILEVILPVLNRCGLLRYSPLVRAIALVFWSYHSENDSAKHWPERAQSALQLAQLFHRTEALKLLENEVAIKINAFLEESPLPIENSLVPVVSEYLVLELSTNTHSYVLSHQAKVLMDELTSALETANAWRGFQAALTKLKHLPSQRWSVIQTWLEAFVQSNQFSDAVTSKQIRLDHYIVEATAWFVMENKLQPSLIDLPVDVQISSVIGDHERVVKGGLAFSIDDFLQRHFYHKTHFVPNYHKYIQLKTEISDKERKRLRLDEFKPRPLTSFVRNKLINDVYLPMIGDNLAKQMGTVGESKRTDLMGLLMMISPPGYGKTTLMEYVANCLGLIFMRINCPSIGHEVDSLDPAQAPNATAKQELIKLNLSLEMGNNVMLYLDDIQHTNPEFLQKFISLCDGTRRIEGVWKEETKTYDMRGKKFCVVMAGNPYTESGEVFKIPDMLANRADVYNLGEVLGGKQQAFELSYIENSLTSNSVLAPLAMRDMQDVYRFVEMAEGGEISTNELSHNYSSVEVNEIVQILKKLLVIKNVVLRVNQQYIASAAQADKYRTEPPFKLQGSYRNMNKMVEKVTAVMNEQELEQLISDHYLGEAQLLTTGAEENILKLKEIRHVLTDSEEQRWQVILEEFRKNQNMGGDDAEVGQKVVGQLFDLVSGIKSLEKSVLEVSKEQGPVIDKVSDDSSKQDDILNVLSGILDKMSSIKPTVEVVNQPVAGVDAILKTLAFTMENSLVPIVHNMDKKLDIDLGIHRKMHQVSGQLQDLAEQIQAKRQNDKE